MKELNRRDMLKAACSAGALTLPALSAHAAEPVPEPKVRDGANFYQSDKVRSHDIVFHNYFGMTLAGTLHEPKEAGRRNGRALAVSQPFAAVRQQAANLYAVRLAEAGFVTLVFDQCFWGESGGTPRGAVLHPERFADVDFPRKFDEIVAFFNGKGWYEVMGNLKIG